MVSTHSLVKRPLNILVGIIKELPRASTPSKRVTQAHLIESVLGAVQKALVREEGRPEQLLTAAFAELTSAMETLAAGDYSAASVDDALLHLIQAKKALSAV